MTNDFRSYNVIYIVYDRKNENHWSLLVTHYSLLGIQTPKPQLLLFEFREHIFNIESFQANVSQNTHVFNVYCN